MAQGNAQALDFVQRFQRFIQVHPADAVDDGSGLFGRDFSHIARLLRDSLQIQPRRDALDPGGEGALAPELGALLERQQEGVLGHVVGQGGLGAHAAQQGAHRRAVPAHQFAELAAAARRREADQFDIVQIT
ncbi:hypothetical protein D3C80_1073510 [compost metagenome]